VEEKIEMRYEGGKRKYDQLYCVFTYKGEEYRLAHHKMQYFAELFSLPEAVREEILRWAKMINNPD